MIKNQKKDNSIKDLEKELQNEIQKNEKDELLKQIKKLEEQKKQLQIENEKMKKELEEKKEILANTQVQYISIKNEFDAYQRRTMQQQKNLERDIFEKLIIKLLPILELFLISYEHLPNEFKNNKWADWLNIINKKILQFLKDYNIEIIPTIWEIVDELKHEIVWVKKVEDKEKKWIIIQEIKKWYVIKYPEQEKVLIPAKVIIQQ